MKRIGFILIFYCFIVSYTDGQNLVPNASFENFNTCAPGEGEFDTSGINFPGIQNWVSPCLFAPQTFAPCLGNVPATIFYDYHAAHTGTAFTAITICSEYPTEIGEYYCHLCHNCRSYVQVQLIQPLKKDTQYCIEFFVENAALSSGTVSYFCSAKVGAYLSVNRPRNYNGGALNTLLRGIQPQIENASTNYICDTSNWQSVHGIFKAQGGEQWITIGNFYNDTETVFNPATAFSSLTEDTFSVILIDDVSVTPITFPQASRDTLLCDTNRFTETLMAQPGGAYYQWNTGETTTTITIHQPGTYWYNTDFGCGPVVDSIHIKFQPPLLGHLPADTNGCAANMPVYLRIDSGFEHYAWNTGDTTAIIAVSDSGTYSVHAVYACGAFSDTVHVVVYPQPALPTAIDTGICVNTGNYLPVISGSDIHYYSSLIDSTGSLLPPEIATATAGSYTFYAAQRVSGCFSGRSTGQVQVIAAPEPDVINNLTLCEGQTLEIGDAHDQYHYLWNTGNTTNLILTDTGGIFILTEWNNCGTVVNRITVNETNCSSCMYIPNAFTPNADGNNDAFKVFTNCPLNFFRCMIFDRIGEKVFESHNPLESWDGTYRGSKLGPAVFVYVITYVSANDQTETLKGSVTLIR